MTRRELFVNSLRLALLRWRVVRGRALPAIGMSLLRWLDRDAAQEPIGRCPFRLGSIGGGKSPLP